MTDNISTDAPSPVQAYSALPQGLLGGVIEAAWLSSARPVRPFAMAAGIGAFCSLASRSFNIKGQGLNQYIIGIGSTGSGKDIIQSFPDLMFNAIKASVPAAADFRGPSELVSAQGMARAFDRSKTKSLLCTVGELAMLAAEMAKPNASPNAAGIQRFLLQIYSKSGRGMSLGEQAYSDNQRTIPVIPSPTLTLMGEGVAETFNAQLDRLMSGGLIPRFMVFEYNGEQVPLSSTFDHFSFDPALIQHLADLAGASLQHAHIGAAQDVAISPKALATLNAFEEHARLSLNGATNEGARHAWNRGHLKALKLAALCAVGINHNAPEIDPATAQWATDLINLQTLNILAKFDNGEAGEAAGNQTLQEREIINVIADYVTKPWSICCKYHGTEAMHEAAVITQAHISQRVYVRKAFKHDPRGAKDAVTRTIKSLLEADTIREIPQSQMIKDFGKHPRAFAISDPAAIIKDIKR